MKSGATVAQDFFAGLRKFPELVALAGEGRSPVARLVYGGEKAQARSDAAVVPWTQIQDVSWG